MRLLLALAVFAFSASHAQAGSAHMKIRGATSQPIGHYMFCKQLPEECSVHSRMRNAPKLTRKRWKDLVEVNAISNNTVKPLTDQEAYGVEEHWTYPNNFGDCEDYVLLKRHMLIQRGWSPGDLLITVVLQPNGDGHAVLTVRTDRADYILDNLEGEVRQWNKTPYRYLKRQSSRHSGRWTKISDNRAMVAGY